MKKCLITVTVLLMMALLSTAAMAANTATVPVTITINAGTLDIEKVNGNLTFPTVYVADVLAAGGATIATTANPTFWVQDATGSGLGWHVNFNITKLTNQTYSAKTLDVKFDNDTEDLLTLYTGTDGQAPVDGYGPMKKDVNVENLNTDTTVVTAATGYGMGKYDFNTTGTNFTIPITTTTAFAGVYSGTFTATVLQGPGGTGSWTGHIE